jgi:hypothetical protein
MSDCFVHFQSCCSVDFKLIYGESSTAPQDEEMGFLFNLRTSYCEDLDWGGNYLLTLFIVVGLVTKFGSCYYR